MGRRAVDQRGIVGGGLEILSPDGRASGTRRMARPLRRNTTRGMPRTGKRDADAIEYRTFGNRLGLGWNVLKTRCYDVIDDTLRVLHDRSGALRISEDPGADDGCALTRLEVFEIKIEELSLFSGSLFPIEIRHLYRGELRLAARGLDVLAGRPAQSDIGGDLLSFMGEHVFRE